MTKKELQKRIQGLNKDIKDKDWYSIDSKNCFKTWNEAEIFLAGLCLGKNTKFNNNEYER